ncbi:MAG: hypothetical protein J6K22_07315 [Spirochaetaceae bacterium]|mgnify:FL=1|nr:type II toxin-antitoxin system Phd/YefM family antitoxin [Spirochaetaceae bacterium]MBP3450252.1 hypothetical protein [Spirochaetaceae bacterium]MBQ3025693.1 hypothetical protein [Spirochaetaceae bacterium]
MLVMTYSEARQNFATALEKSKKDGGVLVTRSDGSCFKITPEENYTSPFENIKTLANIKKEILLEVLRESREED